MPTPAPKQDEKCYNCDRYGHYIAQCRLPTPAPQQQYRPRQQYQQNRRPAANMTCYGCGKMGHLIADCFVNRGQATGVSTSRDKSFKSKKYNNKKGTNKVFKKYENKRRNESDQYDTGDESDISIHNRSVHNDPPQQQVDLPIQYAQQVQWPQQQQQQIQLPVNPYIQGMNHQRPFYPQQSGYFQ